VTDAGEESIFRSRYLPLARRKKRDIRRFAPRDMYRLQRYAIYTLRARDMSGTPDEKRACGA